MKTTIDNRRTVISWWIYHRLDSFETELDPHDIRNFIDEVENDLKLADSILSREYEEYIPQF